MNLFYLHNASVFCNDKISAFAKKNNILYIFVSFADGQDYAVPDVTKSALMVTFPSTRQPSNQSQPNNLDKTPPTYDALYAAADIISSQVPNIPSLQVELDYLEFKFF